MTARILEMKQEKPTEQKQAPETQEQIQEIKFSTTIIMGENDTYLKTLESVRNFTNDIILFVQAKDSFFQEVIQKTRELFPTYRRIIVKRPVLGNSETDRNAITKLCMNQWIFQLDSDEIAVIERPAVFREVLSMFDVLWLPFMHYVDDVLLGFMSPDFHPRLYRTGTVRWLGHVHSYPQVVGNDIVPFTNIVRVDHIRKFSKLITSHQKRRHLLTGNELGMENRFLETVVNLLKSKGKLNERDRKTALQLIQS